MKINSTFFIVLVFILTSGLLVSCMNTETKNHPPVFVKTKSVASTSTTFYDEINGYGTLVAINSLDLETKFDGIVHFKNLKGKIKKGELIYSLHGPEIDLKKESLKKALENAKIQFNYFRQYYEAQKKLLQKNFLSRIDFQKVTKDYQNAQNLLNAAQYNLNYFYSMTSFKAPFDGFLDNIKVPQGEDAVAGQLLGTFQNDNVLKLVAPYYGNLNLLTTKSFPLLINNKNYEGKILYKEQAINPSTGGHTLWITISDPEHHLKSGNYVSFSFLVHKRKSVAVPEAAIIQQDTNYFVITVKKEKYYKTPVKIGQEKNGLIEIKSGLKNGQKVLTQGAFEVFYNNLNKTMQVED